MGAREALQYIKDQEALRLANTPPPPEPQSGLLRRTLGDTAVSALKGAIGVPEAAVGVADLVTGGTVGKTLEETVGFDPKGAKEVLDTLYSTQQQAANKKVQEAEGFTNKLQAAVQNPSTIYHTVVESAPSMLAAGGVGRGVLKLAPKLSGAVAGAAGEGVVSAGQTAEAVRQESPDGTITPRQALIAAGSGALTGGIGAVSGKLANKLGIGDVETMLARGSREVAETATPKNLLRRVAEGALTEGVLEEMPQSAQEQIAQNLAQGKQWDEGVGGATAMGLLAGVAMGAGGNLASTRKARIQEQIREELANPPLATPTLAEQFLGGTSVDQLLAPEAAQVVDAEAATPADMQALLERRRAAEASFDAANPVIPQAPETQPIGVNPYQQFGGMQTQPALTFTPSASDAQTAPVVEVPEVPETPLAAPTPVPEPTSQVTTPEAQLEEQRQRGVTMGLYAGHPEWAPAWAQAIDELGSPNSVAENVVANRRALDIIEANRGTQTPEPTQPAPTSREANTQLDDYSFRLAESLTSELAALQQNGQNIEDIGVGEASYARRVGSFIRGLNQEQRNAPMVQRLASLTGIYNNINAERNAGLVTALESGNAETVLDHISANSASEFSRELASRLRTALDGAMPEIRLREDSNGAIGTYQRGIHTVTAYRNGSTEQAVLHELVHAATVKGIEASPTLKRRIKALVQHVIDTHRGNIDLAHYYGLDYMRNYDGANVTDTMTFEFIAEALSRREFQELLAVTPAYDNPTSVSVWTRLLETICNALGISITNRNLTALDQALYFGSRAINVTRADFGLEGFDLEATGQTSTPAEHLGITPPAPSVASPLEEAQTLAASASGIEAFVRSLYGSGYNASYLNSIANGPIGERLGFVRGWNATPDRERAIGFLEAMQNAGVQSLAAFYYANNPNTPAGVPAEGAIVSAPLTPAEQSAAETLKNSLRANLSASHTNTPDTARPMMKRLDNGARKIWKAISGSISEFRFGGSNKTNVRGIVQDINEHFARRGINKTVAFYIDGVRNPNTTQVTGSPTWKVTVDSGRGEVEVIDGVASGGTTATQGRDSAGDGALGYYVAQLMARNVEGFRMSSGGMSPANQARRPENAASFLFRYGLRGNIHALNDVGINVYNHSGASFGDGMQYNLTRNTATPYASLVVRTLRTTLENYPELTRYTYDFSSGQIKNKADGTAVDPNLIVAHIRSGRTDYRSPVFDSFYNRTAPQVTAGYYAGWGETTSTAVITRAVINQTIYETLLQSSPVAKLNEFARQAQANVNGPVNEVLYSEGERLDKELKPLTPKETEFFNTIFNSEVDLQELMEEVPSAMFEDGVFRIDPAEVDAFATYIDDTVRLEENKRTLPPSFVNGTFAMRFVPKEISPKTATKEGVNPEAQKAADKLSKGLAPLIQSLSGIVPVQVVASPTEVPNPPAGAPEFNAVYHEGTIYVNAQRVTSVSEAERVILDHEVRHHGLRQILGARFKTLMQQVWFNKNYNVKEYARQWGIDVTTQAGRLEAAEEFVVSLAQDAKTHPALDRTIAMLRNAMRSLGFKLKLSTSELRALVAKAGEAKQKDSGAPAETRFMRSPVERITMNREQMKTLGEKLLDVTRQGVTKLHHWLSPQDRLIDFSVSQPRFAPIAPMLKLMRTLNSELQSLQDRITAAGVTLHTKVMNLLTTKGEEQRFNRVMANGTLWGIFAYKEVNEQPWNEKSWETEGMLTRTGMTLAEAHAELRTDWGAMTEAQQTKYKEVIANMEQTRNRYRDEMIRLITQTTPEGAEREAMVASITAKFASIKGPYAPLTRFGDYIVQVYETTPNNEGVDEEQRTARYHFESKAEALQFQAQFSGTANLRATFDVNTRINNTRAELPSELMVKFTQAMEQAGVAGEQLADLQTDLNRIWMSLAPETSALKYNMRRTGLKGYNEDMMRSFMAYTQRHARAIAFLARGGAIRENMMNMDAAISAEVDKPGVNGENINDMRELVRSLKLHDQQVRTEKISPWVSAVSKIPFLWYLARPSVYLVQTAQPFVLAAPRIARKFGMGAALKAVSDHYARQLSKGADGKPLYNNDRMDAMADKANAIEDLMAEQRQVAKDSAPYREYAAQIQGIIDSVGAEDRLMLGMKLAANRQAINITLVHEAQSILNNDINDPMSRNGKWLMDKAGFFMQTSELASRKATFAAAYSLEMERSGDFLKATQYGIDVSLDTLYDYGTANRPEALTGNMGRLLGQFQIFRLHTIFKLAQLAHDSFFKRNEVFMQQVQEEFGVASYQLSGGKVTSVQAKEGVTLTPEQEAEFGAKIEALDAEKGEARKELGFFLASTMAISGTAGLPLAGTVFAALSFLGYLGGDDDPMDAEMEFNRWLRSIPGGEVANKGLPALLGWDLSRRVGMSGMFDLFQGDPPENLKGAQKAAWYAAKLTGPAGGVVTDMFKAQQAFSEGDWGKAVTLSSPQLVRDLAKGYQLASGEGFKTAGGKTLIPADQISVYETVLAFAGINPLDLSLAQEKNMDAAKISTRIADRKRELSKAFTKAVADDDAGAKDRSVAEIRAFNESMPLFAFRGSELAGAVKTAHKKEKGIAGKHDALVERFMEGG